MTLDDIKKMQLGQVVDYCIDYNDRQRKAEKEKDKPKKRRGNQDDINAFFG